MKRRLKREEEDAIQHIQSNPEKHPPVSSIDFSFILVLLNSLGVTTCAQTLIFLCIPSQPQIPSLPLLIPTMSFPRKVRTIQRYILALEYNYTGQQFVQLRRDKGMKHLVFKAKAIIRQSLPIQCVEGLFLAVYFTNGIQVCDNEATLLGYIITLIHQFVITRFSAFQSALQPVLMEIDFII